MYFKKPKTSNDFLFFNKIGAHFLRNQWRFEDDVEEETIRKIHIWSECWEGIIQDPLLFWYLMIIVEIYQDKTWTWSYELPLNRILKISKYEELMEKPDNDLFEELSAWDYDIYKGCHYSMLLVRIAWLTGAFFAFDIRNISLIDYTGGIAKNILRNFILASRDKIPTDDDLDETILALNELSWLVKDDDDKFFEVYNAKKEAPEKPIIGDEDFYDIYPVENNENRVYEVWERVAFFGEFSKIRFDFDKENMEKLQFLTVNTVSSFLVNLNPLTYKFIKMAKKWEKIENTLYIPFETLFTDFPLIQFLYSLQENDGCDVASWLIEDDWVVTIYDEIIADALGMSHEKKKEAIKNVIFDYTKEALCIDEQAISLRDTNNMFVKMFFDLEKSWVVDIDELAESIDPIVIDMNKEERSKAEKTLVYDRVPQINNSLRKELGMEKFFSIQNRKVKLNYPEILEKSPKTPRKK